LCVGKIGVVEGDNCQWWTTSGRGKDKKVVDERLMKGPYEFPEASN
jgi:hypothetical protein